jgi:putative phosphoribosyl transferase
MKAGRFADRTEAGRALAEQLLRLQLPAPAVVLALPRGGVPVAAEIARALGAALDLVLVRKIGAPWQPELAVAAVVEGNPPHIVVDEMLRDATGVDRDYIDSRVQAELREIARRRHVYLQGRTAVDVEGRTVIMVDDGIATGTTMRAALKALRKRRPALLVLAVPVAPADTLDALRGEVDRVVCLAQPSPFHAVGLHYDDFHQVSDAEVIDALESVRGREPEPPP